MAKKYDTRALVRLVRAVDTLQLHNRKNSAGRTSGISRLHVKLLYFLHICGPATYTETCRTAPMARNYCQPRLTDLQRFNLITEDPTSPDGLNNTFEITEAGRKYLEELEKRLRLARIDHKWQTFKTAKKRRLK